MATTVKKKKSTKATTDDNDNTFVERKEVLAVDSDGNEIVGEMQKARPLATTYIETGNVGLDIVLTNGKGIPEGANIMFFGPPGTGKTTIFGDIIKRLMDKYKQAGLPLRMHYVDSESSRELLRSTGVLDYVYDKEEYAPQQVIYHEYVNSFEELENIYTRMLTPKDNWNKDVKFVFIDSITKLLAKSQLENDVDKADYGDNAKARKKLYGKWLSNIQALGITQFWSSQMSIKQNAGMYEDPRKPAVSEFDKHNMDIIVKITATKDTKLVDIQKVTINTIVGEKTDVPKYLLTLDPGQNTHTKNRYGQNVALDMMIYRGHGIINAFILRKMLESFKYIKKCSDGATNYAISQELADYLGAEALEKAGVVNIEKVPRKPVINRLCSMNNVKLVEFFKAHGQYCIEVSRKEDDDGLF